MMKKFYLKRENVVIVTVYLRGNANCMCIETHSLVNRPWRQETDLDEPPWGDPVKDKTFRQIYEGNQNVILADAKSDKG